jgi:hypothetical protein
MRGWSLLLVSLLLTPCVSAAGTIFIDFELSSSAIRALGGQIVVPPDGSITSGTLTLAVPGTDASSPGPGPVEISGLVITADFTKTQFGITLSGTFGLTQQGAAAGTLGPDLASLALPGLTADIAVHAECSGAFCTGFPVDQIDTAGLAGSGFTLEDLAQPGMATLFGSLESAPGQPIVELSAKETSRHFVVPEPATGTLALVGLSWLAALARRPRD